MRGEQTAEQMGGEDAEGSAEVVEDEFGEMVGGVSVTGEFFAFDPVGDGEVEGGAGGEVHESEAGGFLLVFLQDQDGGVVPVGGEFGDLSDGEFVASVVRGSRDVDAVGEEGGEEFRFVVEGGVEGCGDEEFGGGKWGGGEEGGEFAG